MQPCCHAWISWRENCAEYLKSHKRWLNYFTFWKQGGKDHTAEQLATEMEGIIEELGNSDQNLVLNKLMDYPLSADTTN